MIKYNELKIEPFCKLIDAHTVYTAYNVNNERRFASCFRKYDVWSEYFIGPYTQWPLPWKLNSNTWECGSRTISISSAIQNKYYRNKINNDLSISIRTIGQTIIFYFIEMHTINTWRGHTQVVILIRFNGKIISRFKEEKGRYFKKNWRKFKSVGWTHTHSCLIFHIQWVWKARSSCA